MTDPFCLAPPQGPPGQPLLLVAAAALIDVDNRVLVARRPPGKHLAGLWEFPGGKVEPGETPEACLVRELGEELAVETTAACLSPAAFASHAYADFHLILLLFACRRWTGMPRHAEGGEVAWHRPNALFGLAMPPADKPLVAALADLL